MFIKSMLTQRSCNKISRTVGCASCVEVEMILCETKYYLYICIFLSIVLSKSQSVLKCS